MIRALALQECAPAAALVERHRTLNPDPAIALARLDERLMHAPPAVREGWIRRAFLHEAVASLRLNGFCVAARDLMLMLEDASERIPDQDLSRAMAIHQMIASVSRRDPRHLFNARRLLVMTSLRLRGKPPGHPNLPSWLNRHRDPEQVRDTLDEALWPSAIASWEKLPPLEAAAAIIAHWHATGAAESIGAAPGRALAMAWVHRAGLVSGYYFLPGIGFFGHALDYRPDLQARWLGLFLESASRSVDWGLKLHRHLSAIHRRLHEAAPGKRSTSHMAALIDLLVAHPALSADRAAQRLGITSHAVRGLLVPLEKKGLVHELTGRGSFRLYGLPP
jgi:HTH DNA binding domain